MKKALLFILLLVALTVGFIIVAQDDIAIFNEDVAANTFSEAPRPQKSSYGVQRDSSNSFSPEVEAEIVDGLLGWQTNGSEVYFEDSRAYISATDNTNEPLIKLISKNYDGNINIAFGFDTHHIKPTGAWYNTGIQNVTKSYVCPYEFNYTTGEGKEFWCYYTNDYTNSTPDETIVVFNREYEEGNVSAKTAYWTEEEEVWSEVSGQFKRTTLFLNNTNTWFYKENFNVNPNQTYELRLRLQPQFLKAPRAKYWIAFYPSSKTIKEAVEDDMFYALDPWTSDLSTDLENYYKFDEGAGATGTIIDEIQDANLTNSNAANDSGKIGSSYYFDGGTDYMSGSYSRTFSDITIACWYKSAATPDSFGGIMALDSTDFYYRRDGANPNMMFAAVGGYVVYGSAGSVDGDWHLGVGTWSDTDDTIEFWVDNSSQGTDTGTSGTIAITSSIELGRNEGNDLYSWKGNIDECGIWSRRLTDGEIGLLWNGGDGITYTDDTQNPNATVYQPADHYASNNENVTFIAAWQDTSGLQNVSYYLDGVVDQTNTSGINNTNYTFTDTLTDGNYSWFMGACDVNNLCTNTTTRTLVIDSTAPTINITAPTNDTTHKKFGDSEYLNWTLTEENPDQCWYDYAGSNTTVTCSANTTSFTINDFDSRSGTFWVNDTAGSELALGFSFDYKITEKNYTFVSSATSGNEEDYKAYIQVGDAYSVTSANLTYNGTTEAASFVSDGDNVSIQLLNREVPAVLAAQNVTFYFTVGLNDSSAVNLSSQVQTVNNIQIDNCSTNNETLYNFTMVDEEQQTLLDPNTWNTTARIDLDIYTSSRATLLQEYSALFNKTNPFAVCLDNNLSSGETFSIDVQVQYAADSYSTEYYNIFKEELTNADFNTNITLYSLLAADAQEFQITYKDENFIGVQDALIQVQRKYIDEGVFKTVEIPRTDALGETLAHLVLSDVIYNLIVVVDGSAVAAFNNVLAVCANVATGDCTINLNSFTGGAEPTGFIDVDGYSFAFDYEESTDSVEAQFTVTSGATTTSTLNVTLFSGSGSQLVCSDTLTTSSGTLSCAIPASFENQTVVAQLYEGDTLMGQTVMTLDQDAEDIYGSNQIFLGIFLILILIGMGVSESPYMMGFMLILGAIMLFAMNLINGVTLIGAGSALVWFITAVILLLIKARKV